MARTVYESDVEDYLAANYWAHEYTEDWWFVGRQIVLPHGRLDLLFYDGQLLIVELKAGPLRARDICQVLRYQLDIRNLIRNDAKRVLAKAAAYGYQRYGGNSLKEYRDYFRKTYLQRRDIADEPLTCPVLIGSAAPEEVIAAMDAVGGRIYTWTQTQGGFDFEMQLSGLDPLSDDNIGAARSWLDAYYGVMRDNATIEADREQELLTYRLFGDAVFHLKNRGDE